MTYIVIEATLIGLGAMIGAFIGTILGSAMMSWRKRRAIRQMIRTEALFNALTPDQQKDYLDAFEETPNQRPTTRRPNLD